ncbi:L,D-transpeptidase-like protein [Marivita geojedonensis]|nr:L,D-transpeptidase-like protein [Marivita geojedonensis]
MGRGSIHRSVHRRRVLAGLTTGVGMLALPGAAEIIIDIDAMKPGEFAWHPEMSPHGSVAIIVSLPEQRVHVYRNGIRIAVSTCSTGKPGHETPTGIFTILQKDKDHRSSTYNNAPMPNMNRLTWDGVALHAGKLPGYPASHGCVRLPMAFSERLFTITHVGTPVIIAGSHTDPWELTHPGRLLTGGAEGRMEMAVAELDMEHHPSDWPVDASYPVSTLLASSAERRIYLFSNGREIASESISIAGNGPFGEHVLILERHGNVVKWVGITHHPDPMQPQKPEESVVDRIQVSDAFNRQLRSVLHPGMTMIVSDLPSHPDRRSDEDFVILSS